MRLIALLVCTSAVATVAVVDSASCEEDLVNRYRKGQLLSPALG